MEDKFNLQSFVEAQEGIYSQVRTELQRGRKASHWMWFIFPQIHGLGSSSTAMRYAISSLDEARAYLKHPVLGPRLLECTQLVTRINGSSAAQIFGYPDDLKFRSSMTLFAHAAEDPTAFKDALQKYFAGEEDPRTVASLDV